MTDATPNMPKKIILGRAISFSCVLGLIMLYTLTAGLNDNLNLVLWIIPCLSLVIFLPGMMRDQYRSYSWLCFVILIHFTVSITGIMSELAAWNDLVQLILSVSLFNAAMMTSRWMQAWKHETNINKEST